MSKFVLGLVLLAICLSCFCSFGASKRLEAKISEEKNFIFLSKFVVAGKGAQMVFESSDMEPKKDSEDKKMELDLYNGEKGKKWYWNDVWDDDDSSSNCDKKQGDQHSLSNTAYINGTKWDFPFNEKDPLAWYVAASDCSLGKNDKFQMTVNIHWTNPGSGWYKEFSLEEQDLLTLYLVFTIFWIFFIPVHIVGMIKFRSRKDSTDWAAYIFNTIITLYFIALWMYLIHYAVYASDGVGVPGFLIAADIFDMFQTVLVFVLLVMLASKASHPLDMHWGKVGALALMLLIYMSFFIWQEVYTGVDMEFFSYKWETPPGIVMLIFLSFVWVTFVGSGAYSIWQEKEGAMNRKIFFSVFLGIFSVWFLALPFMATVMAGAPFYYRWKAVLGVVLTVNLFTYGFMSQMLLDTPVSRLFRGTKADTKNAASQDLLDKEDDYTPYGTL